MLVRIAALLTLIMPTSGQSSGQAPPFEDLAHRAEVARDAKRLDDALTLYKRALKLKPGWEDGWWNAGSIAYDSNQYKECASDFRRLAALSTLTGWVGAATRPVRPLLHRVKSVVANIIG